MSLSCLVTGGDVCNNKARNASNVNIVFAVQVQCRDKNHISEEFCNGEMLIYLSYKEVMNTGYVLYGVTRKVRHRTKMAMSCAGSLVSANLRGLF